MRFTAILCLCALTQACSSDDSGSGPASGGSGGTGGSGLATGGGGAPSGGGGAPSGGGGAPSGGTGGMAGGSSGGAGGTTGTPEVRFIGRFDQSESGVTKLAWSGSGIVFRFSGTDAAVKLDDAAKYFTVLVDGQLQPNLATSSGEQSYTVASGLAAGEHEVRLYRRTEASFGVTRFVGVEFPNGGTLLAPPAAAPRRIEVIGDSISCGYGNEGTDQYCNFSAATENHYLTYGAITARDLNADVVTVAWSGKGIIFNYGDDKNQPLPELYDRTLPYDATSTWSFAWQPDVVVLNLGTNDFSTGGDPTQSEFSGAYEAFLKHIRTKNPNAWIICLVPTLLGGSDLALAEGYIDAVVSKLKSAGDSKLKSVSLSFQSEGWGCDWHPSLKTHANMAQALTAELKSTLGW